MFDFEYFLKNNLIEAYITKSFNEVQINIFAINYLMKGMLSQEVFNEVMQEIENIKNSPELEEGGLIDE